MPAPRLRVAVDARPVDIDGLRERGIGRFAANLVEQLVPVARDAGGELVLLRERRGRGSPYHAVADPAGAAQVVRPRRPPVPARIADLPEQLLLPIDLRRARVDLYHALSIYRAPVRPGVPAIVTIHDLIPLMWPGQLRTGIVHGILYRAARAATRVIAVSQRVKEDAVVHLGLDAARVDVVYEAVADHFVPTDPGAVPGRLGVEGPYVLYVGGPDPRKRMPELIDGFGAWARAQARPETLVIAGPMGCEAAELEARARKAGGRTVFCGFVPDADLPALYSGARCLVMASRYEGFGLPALEALSCGTPVVFFDGTGALPEVAGPGALTAPMGDAEALMGAVERLCDDEQLRARLSATGLEHARGFSWRATAEQTWAAYESAVGSGRS
jgi:glycosyltransferase involved in cell wall biosynthesis